MNRIHKETTCVTGESRITVGGSDKETPCGALTMMKAGYSRVGCVVNSLLNENKAILIIIGFALIARVYEFLIHGPVLVSDSRGYLQYAECLRNGTCIHSIPAPPNVWHESLYRLVGYPALLYIARLLSEKWMIYIAIVSQIIMGCIMVYLVFAIAEKLTNKKTALLSAFLYAVSSTIRYEIWISTDFVYSFFLIASVFLILQSNKRWEIILCAGVAYAFSAIVRQTGLLYLVFFIALAYVRTLSIRRCVIFALPLMLTLTLYSTWNRHRADTWELCPSDGYVLLDRYIQYGDFNKDTVVDRVARSVVKDKNECLDTAARVGMSRCLPVSLLGSEMARRYNLSQIDINGFMRKRAISGMIEHPAQQLLTTTKNLILGFKLFDSSTLDTQGRWKGAVQWIASGGRSKIKPSMGDALRTVSIILFWSISLFVLLINIVYVIYLFASEKVRYRREKIVLLLFSFAVLMFSSFASYGFTRFLLPAFPFMIIFAIDCLMYIHSRRALKHPVETPLNPNA